MKKILVTGATGFVGKHLCRYLSKQGSTVRAAVRKSLPEGFPAQESIRIGEIGPDTDWRAAVDGIDYVVHLAALAHQIGKNVPAADFFRINTQGTESLARAVKSSQVKRLIFISSIGAVCSMANEVVTSETPCRPDTEYGRSKLEAEEKVRGILSQGSPDWCIIRPTLIYGPENPGNMQRLLRLIQTGLPLPLGSIINRRTFLYIENLLSAIGVALEHPSASRGTFLLADEEIFTTPELLRALGKSSAKRVKLIPFPSSGLRMIGRVGDLVRKITGRSAGLDTYSVDRLLGSLEVDASSFRKGVGWSQPIAATEGLKRTVDWCFSQGDTGSDPH